MDGLRVKIIWGDLEEIPAVKWSEVSVFSGEDGLMVSVTTINFMGAGLILWVLKPMH